MTDPRDIATRMRAIEDNITGETSEDAPSLVRTVAVLLDLPENDELLNVLNAEAIRVLELQDGWYSKHGVKRTPVNVAALGFIQGITFAVAAQRLREP